MHWVSTMTLSAANKLSLGHQSLTHWPHTVRVLLEHVGVCVRASVCVMIYDKVPSHSHPQKPRWLQSSETIHCIRKFGLYLSMCSQILHVSSILSDTVSSPRFNLVS